MTLGTVFDARTSTLSQKRAWEDWWGYHTVRLYEDALDIEYNAVREGAGLIDVSPLFKYLVSGPDAVRLINRIITRDARKLQVDQVYYTPWCDERGKLIDDGTVCRLDESTYRWTAAEPNYRWFNLNASGLDVRVEDISGEVGALALQGPTSRSLLEAVTGEDWIDLKYFRRRPTKIAGFPVDVTRTGYTGDLGYELWVESSRAVELWDALFRVGSAFGLRPVGTAALDVLRVEAGLILIGAEFISVRDAFTAEQEYSPFELGFGRLVDLEKDRFVGRKALATEQEAGGPPRRLVGLEFDWADIEGSFERHGLPTVLLPETSTTPVPLYVGSRQIGMATSTTWSPTLKKVIALALVEKAFADLGARLDVEWTVQATRDRVAATVVELPFFDPPRKRA
ncbi:MAG: aminomethyl transferase family protein [Actinobacteria bacterium]|nr:MAG: aminomethyl transferase family protein [Actinomycetota bacterium]